jgi:chromosome segregation ATPase
MNRLLQYANLIGVIVLVVLCAIQWSANRRANLDVNALEKTRLELTEKVGQQGRDIKAQAADLDAFREQLALATSSLKETETKLAQAGRDIAQLETEREQLKISVTNWVAAVTARDQRIKEGNERIQKLGDDLNASIRKFNELAEVHTKLVKDWNDQQAKLAAMRTNTAKPTSP